MLNKKEAKETVEVKEVGAKNSSKGNDKKNKKGFDVKITKRMEEKTDKFLENYDIDFDLLKDNLGAKSKLTNLVKTEFVIDYEDEVEIIDLIQKGQFKTALTLISLYNDGKDKAFADSLEDLTFKYNATKYNTKDVKSSDNRKKTKREKMDKRRKRETRVDGELADILDDYDIDFDLLEYKIRREDLENLLHKVKNMNKLDALDVKVVSEFIGDCEFEQSIKFLLSIRHHKDAEYLARELDILTTKYKNSKKSKENWKAFGPDEDRRSDKKEEGYDSMDFKTYRSGAKKTAFVIKFILLDIIIFATFFILKLVLKAITSVVGKPVNKKTFFSYISDIVGKYKE